MKNNFVDEIVKAGSPCYFISPHLDDAVFSAGGLMSKLAGKVAVTVINVFTNAGNGPNSLSASAYLRQCHADNAKKLYESRRKEDNAALTSLGVEVVNLNHTDALWRTVPGRVRRSLGGLLPEFARVYPTYRLNITSGHISRYDESLMASIRDELKKYIPDDAVVFCPAGYGNHVDHVLVREVCRRMFYGNLVYWKDFPYALTDSKLDSEMEGEQYTGVIVKHDGRAKLQACKLYETQFTAVIKDPATLGMAERFFKVVPHPAHSLPESIVSYHLVREVIPEHAHAHYSYGVYQDKNGTEAYIKYWRGTQKNAAYYWLKNEIRAYELLSSNDKKQDVAKSTNPVIHTPRFLGSRETGDELMLFLEVIEGGEITKLESLSKVALYRSATEMLQSVSAKIPRKKADTLVQRKPLFWAALLPFLSVKTFMRHPAMFGLILRANHTFYCDLKHFLSDHTTSLVHRDLGDWNIWRGNGGNWLFDFQLASFAHPYIDHAVILQRHWDDTKFTEAYLKTPELEKIRESKEGARLLCDYSIVFTMYDLSISDDFSYRKSLAYLNSLVPKRAGDMKLRKPWNTAVLGTVVFVFATLIFAFSVRGRTGDPTAAALSTPAWQENGPFELSPERGRYALAYSLVKDHTFFFSADLARFVMPDLGYLKGHYVSIFAPAVSYFIIPGFMIGQQFGDAQVGAFATIAIFALCNLFLIYVLARRLGVRPVAALLAGVIFAFATPSFAYSVTLYEHEISTFLILSSLYLVLTYDTFWSLALVWFMCAMSIPVDYPNLVLMFPIGLYALGRVVNAKIQDTKMVLSLKIVRMLTFVSMVVPVLFFLWFNKMSYGNPLQFSGTVPNAPAMDQSGRPIPSPSPVGTNLEKSFDAAPQQKSAVGFFQTRNLLNGLYIHLLSPDRGVITFTPVIILGIIGCYFLYKKNKTAAVILSSVALADLLLYSMWGDPWGGWAFGSRYLIPAYAVLAVCLGSFLERFRKYVVVLVIFLVLAGYSVYVNTAGALSSNANPPQVQVLSLEALSHVQERYSYDRNIYFLRSGSSKSFAYETWLQKKISAWDFFVIVAGSIVGLITVLTIALYREENPHV